MHLTFISVAIHLSKNLNIPVLLQSFYVKNKCKIIKVQVPEQSEAVSSFIGIRDGGWCED